MSAVVQHPTPWKPAVRSLDGAMSLRTALWLGATGGSADGTRIALTAVGAAAGTLALLAAATVGAAGAGAGPYTSALLNQPGLHPGVQIALALLCLPLLAFVGQCARIGAPARDRRLAILRLQGATGADVVRVAANESVLASALGAAVGTGLYFLLRMLLGDRVTSTYTLERELTYDNGSTGIQTDTITGPALRLPTDVLPPWPVLVAIAIAIPLLAGVFTVIALRRVTISPFGVVRREDSSPARAVPALLFAGGTVLLGGFSSMAHALHLNPNTLGPVLLVVFLATGVGLLMGTTAVSAGIGHLLATRARRPSLLIAGRRLLAAPGQSTRANAALLLVVMLWAFARGFRVQLLAGPGLGDPSFYVSALNLVDLAFAVGAAIAAASLLIGTVESVLTRRRLLAGLIAVGTPRAVLYRATLVETMAPLVPAVILAAAAGILGARGVLGAGVQYGLDYRPLPVPWAALGALTAGPLLAVLAVTVLTLPLLRRSTDPSELRAE